MLPNEFDFLLPPLAPFEAELPEAFDRALPEKLKLQNKTRAKNRRRKAAPDEANLLDQFLSELKTERGLSRVALRSYENDVQLYLSWLQHQNRPLRQVTAEHLENYRRALQSGQIHKIIPARKRPAPHAKFYTTATLARKLAVVREWHRFLARHYKWPDPAGALGSVRLSAAATSSQTRLILSEAQIQALLNSPNRLQTLGKRDRAILYLLCEGFSAPEIGALLRDAEWDSRMKISEEAHAVLREYSEVARPLLAAKLKQKKRYSFRLFFSTHGTPLSPASIHQIVRRYAQAAQLPLWVSPVNLAKSGALRRAGRENLAALPRSTQLRHAYEKAHPRA